MTRIGVETQNSHGKSFVLVVPDVSVYDPVMSDNLIPVGCLIKGGVTVNHRIPVQANEDGCSLKVFPLYGGTIMTPDGKTINVMEYAQHTWRLPLSSNKRVTKPKLPPRATSEIFVDSRSAGSSFSDPINSYYMLDEIDEVDTVGKTNVIYAGQSLINELILPLVNDLINYFINELMN